MSVGGFYVSPRNLCHFDKLCDSSWNLLTCFITYTTQGKLAFGLIWQRSLSLFMVILIIQQFSMAVTDETFLNNNNKTQLFKRRSGLSQVNNIFSDKSYLMTLLFRLEFYLLPNSMIVKGDLILNLLPYVSFDTASHLL